ncbi:hypothetical protein [Mesotoga sp.]|uniref:hypothetical protein n=1 Tax=Mesotoga sp. TaxID=2053577 RepID=UPI00345E6DFD
MKSFVDEEFSIFPVTHFGCLRFVPPVKYHERFSRINPIIESVRPSITLDKILIPEGFKHLLTTDARKEFRVPSSSTEEGPDFSKARLQR